MSQGNPFGFGSYFDQNDWARIRKILIHPTNNDILYVAAPTGVFKTTNALDPAGSVTWMNVLHKNDLNGTTGGDYFDIQFKPGTNGQTIVVSGKKLVISHDAGSTWSLLADYNDLGKTTASQQDKLISIRFAESDPDILYGAYHKHIFRFDLDAGAVTHVTDVGGDGAWPPSPKYSRQQALAVSPFDEDEVLIGNVRNIFKSTDGGQNFPTSSIMLPQQYHDDQHWIEYRSANEIWIANDGGVYKTTDGGQNWTNLSDGMGIAIYFHLSSSEARPYDIIGAGWDTGPNMYQASTGTFTWTRQFGDAFESLIDDSDPANPVYYTSTNSGNSMYRFTSIGSSTPITVPTSIQSKEWDDHFVKASNSQDVLFYAGDRRIGRSIDQGGNWEPISFDAKAANPDRVFFRVWNNPSNDNFLYAHRVNFKWQNPDPDGFALYKSTNALRSNPNQVTWTDITPTLAGYNSGQPIRMGIGMLAVDDEDPNKVWLVYSGYNPANPKVLMYEDGTWSDITGTGLEGQSVTTIAHQNGTDDLIYVGTNAGVYYKKDHETQWTLIPGVPHCKITDMEINHCESKIRVSTFGRGIWEADLIENTSYDKSEVDLYMKDNIEDIGQSPSPGLYTDNGPDIWYRNQNEGKIIYDTDELTWTGDPFWVYVRVRNKSCQTSSGGTLDLYWSKAGTAFSWVNGHWTNGVDGDLIGSKPLPEIAAGGSAILEFEWDMTGHIQSFPQGEISACLLARIENLVDDPIDSKPTLWEDVKYNNNLTMNNLKIQDVTYFSVAGNREPILVGGIEDGGVFDINFELPETYTGSPLYEEAEITFQLDHNIWQKWDQAGRAGNNIEVFDEPEHIILVTGANARIENLTFAPDERDEIGMAVNFLIDEVSEQMEFPYIVRQSVSNSEISIGAVHYLIRKEPRDYFDAYAGGDRQMYYSDSTTLQAASINEPAEYNWYDAEGNKIHSGMNTTISPKQSKAYKLEVISLIDGFKDYDYLNVTVKDLELLQIVPNPASSKVEITYSAVSVKQSASLMISNVNGGAVSSYALDPSKKSIALDVTAYPPGLYKVVLVCDGEITDHGSLAIQ